ncbi:histidinol phosphatase [Flavobacterium akiainvivens]|uniref:protein-tyrosine-phosphatase n=1 Tax=Flavobacterium akiainvivens TaxID=1202724 RepID=A0A0M8MB22_9FLAO|nr:CpsB/CapC family capsule biosynthesis tyrosine phosphatase [Flavobacterium akiainvivens]KOS06355.1 histidinol phosphatase [Flavobacterium akiainvivens]SFQ15343.1 Tyrosine-protein phosphatase YwqE [Flavobacterium akiainvivens]
MLFFKKPKARLADLIPDGYVDIHSHLLPGIDDGSKDNNNSLALINSLKEYGFGQFITTPHILTGVYNNTREGILAVEEATKTFLTGQGITQPFKAAAEYLMDDSFLNLVKSGKPLLTLKDDYVLVEMSYINPPMQLYDCIYELQLAGYKPVLAHPERYVFYHLKPEEYTKLKKSGCKFQLNLLSVTGYYGKPVFEIAQKLLEDNMIDFTGSDTHHERHTDAFKNPVLLKNTDKLKKVLENNSHFSL